MNSPMSPARVVIYEAFVEDKLEAPKHFARTVHDLYFAPSGDCMLVIYGRTGNEAPTTKRRFTL